MGFKNLFTSIKSFFSKTGDVQPDSSSSPSKPPNRTPEQNQSDQKRDNAQRRGTQTPESQKKTGQKREQERSPNHQKNRSKNRVQQKSWSLESFQVPPQEDKTRFHDFDLPLGVMHAIADLGFQYCTPIQGKLLEHTLCGKDATAKAQTGTGKSASFIITLLSAFIRNPKKLKRGNPRALILAPTRELVHQIEKDFVALGKYSPINIAAVYGGTGYHKQQQQLTESQVDVIVATPGRLIDFMSKRLINVSSVEIAIIDEADRMLDMGFIPDVRRIIYKTPHKKDRQTLFFSATLTEDVLRLAASWTKDDAVQIEIDPEQAAAVSICQIIYITTEDDKFKHVFNLISQDDFKRVIMFVNRKDTARLLHMKLQQQGKKCAVLSGDVSQDQRFKVLNRFKKGHIQILVATDVAARGLHIEDISHVINYDLPFEPEHYIHRIGRTGRAGNTGTSISFADETSSFLIPGIEEVLGHSVTCEYVPEELETPLPPVPEKKPDSGDKKRSFRKKRRNFRRPRTSQPSPKS